MIRASVSAPYLNLTWAVNYVLPVVDVSYVLITFEAVTDDLGQYRRYRDAFLVSESLANHLVKVRVDGAEAAESYSSAVGKSLSDAFTASDLFDRVVSYIRGFSDGAEATESYASEFGKVSANAGLATDSDPVRAFGKGLANTVGATDDLDGAASILDDQVMSFFKATSHGANVSEVFDRTVVFDRSFSDAYTTSDLYTSEYGKNAADTFTVAETFNSVLGKAQTNASQTSDSHILQLGKPATDQSVVSDANLFAFAKPLANGGEASDVLTLTYSPALANTLEAAESQTTAFSKALSDTPIFSDSFVQSLGKIRSDSATSSDSGTLLNQDYVDNPFYFAGDYVGVSRSF